MISNRDAVHATKFSANDLKVKSSSSCIAYSTWCLILNSCFKCLQGSLKALTTAFPDIWFWWFLIFIILRYLPRTYRHAVVIDLALTGGIPAKTPKTFPVCKLTKRAVWSSEALHAAVESPLRAKDVNPTPHFISTSPIKGSQHSCCCYFPQYLSCSWVLEMFDFCGKNLVWSCKGLSTKLIFVRITWISKSCNLGTKSNCGVYVYSLRNASLTILNLVMPLMQFIVKYDKSRQFRFKSCPE